MDYKEYKLGMGNSYFWHRAKKDLIAVLMSKVAVKNKKLRILSLGAGTGEETEILNKYGDVYVVDINKDTLKLIPKNLCFQKKIADACKLPFKENFFDLAASFDVFEHISDDTKSVSEVYRVLKRKGLLIFSVPAFQFLFSSHDRAAEHKRRYNKRSLKKLLKKFNNLKLNYWNFVLFLPIAYIRLMKKKSEVNKLDYVKFPKFLNLFFYNILKVENKSIKNDIPLPFGLTIIGSCKK